MDLQAATESQVELDSLVGLSAIHGNQVDLTNEEGDVSFSLFQGTADQGQNGDGSFGDIRAADLSLSAMMSPDVAAAKTELRAREQDEMSPSSKRDRKDDAARLD